MPAGHWRDLMNAFTIEFPSICLRALLAGYSTCGSEYQDAHYSGNFWWARCDHVARLKPLRNPFDAHAAEFFVLKSSPDYGTMLKLAENCGYNPFHCGVNHYDFQCPRTLYAPTVLRAVIGADAELPHNPTHSLPNRTAAFIRERCAVARRLPARDKARWLVT